MEDILDVLNEFLRSGQLTSASPTGVLREDFLANFLEALRASATESLKEAAAASGALDRRISRWWRENAVAYGALGSGPVSFADLSLVMLTSWTNRLLFGHYLKAFHQAACTVEDISGDCTMERANAIFETVSAECDFMHLFEAHPFSDRIGKEAWNALVPFNEFLGELGLRDLPRDQFGSVLERLLIYSRRKASGQFVTPPALGRLLVALTMEERDKAVLDPCCGSGQIARAAYLEKRRAGIGAGDAIRTVWASDKFHFPLQLCTLELSDPESIGEPLRIFRHDVFELKPGAELSLIDPNTGNPVTMELERPATIVSNLPFVRAEDYRAAATGECHAVLDDDRLGNRADLFARVLLHLADLVSENGRIGVVIGNSWLGTEWGLELRHALRERFQIETVVISGAGRWFAEPDVVTTILVLRRRTGREDPSRFVTMLKPIRRWTPDLADRLAHDLDDSADLETAEYRIRHQAQALIRTVETSLGRCTALFGNCDWLPHALDRLVLLRDLFTVRRGERRGWNEMFYPGEDHGIEPEYLAPALRSTSGVVGLVASPDAVAFCCSADLETLRQRGHVGARKWIERFARARNQKGRPLPEVLEKAGHHWYEMKANRKADFVLSVNPGRRLFVACMKKPSFVDQRLIALSAREDQTDLALLHALMNSTLCAFFIEATGFGRGLGALDLSKDRVEAVLRVPDPSRIGTGERDRIVAAFHPLLSREVRDLPEELASAGRKRFDEVVLRAIGLDRLGKEIRESLRSLYGIRAAAQDEEDPPPSGRQAAVAAT